MRPSARSQSAQWRRIRAAVPVDVVQAGPFAGMKLAEVTSGSGVPKRLGCYEQELHPLIESWAGYDRVVNIGCGEGWYAVGLARRMPDAEVWGFDISPEARSACARAAAVNGVSIHIEATAGPRAMQRLAGPGTLVIADAEGAEIDVLDPAAAPGLASADILVETHDFLRPGATEAMLRRFAGRAYTLIEQRPRDPGEFPVLARLTAADQQRALSEGRPRGQRWLWLPAALR
jgi:SAM-dependent methyltransferase